MAINKIISVSNYQIATQPNFFSLTYQPHTSDYNATPKVFFPMSEVQKLEEEVKRLRTHLDNVEAFDQQKCAEEFRKHVAGAREPFHNTHDETNPWTEANDKGCNSGGCTIC